MRPKLGWRTASKEQYKVFCESHPHINITFDQYKQVLYKFNERLYLHILTTGDKIKLPWGMGTLTICKYRKTLKKKNDKGEMVINLAVDWKKTRELGKYVYHTNLHTEGYNYYWHWNSSESRMKCAFAWKFEMARIPRRLLPVFLRDTEKDYKNLYKKWINK